MAHEIEIRDGAASFFAVRQSAWHGLGTILHDAPSRADAMRLARLDYEVVKRPYFQPAPYTDNDFIESEVAFYTQRTDTERVLGVVGPEYRVVTNEEAFRTLDPLLDTGLLTLESGGVLRDGADAWLLGKWARERMDPLVQEVFRDELEAYALIVANHEGKRKVVASLTPIRVVCANTLAMSLHSKASRMLRVRHSASASTKLVDAAMQLWGGVVAGYKEAASHYQVLRQTTLDEREFATAVLDVIAPMPEPRRGEIKRDTSYVVDRAVAKRARLRQLWTEGTGHVGDLSAWEAWQGAIEALDHHRDVFPVAEGQLGPSLLEGAIATKKAEVLDSLLSLR